MYCLQRLALENFRNHAVLNVDFSPHFNCVVGENGAGKTNLLDAIHFACFAKSGLGLKDKETIKNESHYLRLQAEFIHPRRKQVCLYIARTGKKEILCDQLKRQRSNFVGEFPVMMVSPQDEEIIVGGHLHRRRFFDLILSQKSKTYCKEWIAYNAHLKQRNALLKKSHLSRSDHTLLSVYDEPIIALSASIAQKRKNYVAALLPHYQRQYDQLSQHEERVDLVYDSEALREDWPHIFKEGRKRDILYKTSHHGIHKDTFEVLIEGYSAKTYASQGQKKNTFLCTQTGHHHQGSATGGHFAVG